ncbi:MAG: hypothetical protein CFE44_02340 [Burkholderiales bacterium PBB4]|nr:MAG: hypothetical protein CFE44_02340 [Burkholderiales bacterium PBB4]
MTAADASRTAMATSLMRAVHARQDPAPVLNDTWGEQLVPPLARAAFIERGMERVPPALRERAMANPDALLHRVLRSNAAYADVILRARYAEDALQAAVTRGVSQYVIIGAGFDSFALRRPAYAAQLAIYEVDHPATQRLKRQRLTESGVADADAPHFIATDLSTEGLGAALARSTYQTTQPSFFSWLGVTMYLTREVNLATLRAIATHAPPGSELVFNYVDEAAFDPSFSAPQSLQDLKNQVASVGESFQSGFDPQTLAAELRAVGLLLLEDLDGNQLLSQYDSSGKNGLHSPAAAHIAHARIIAKGQSNT